MIPITDVDLTSPAFRADPYPTYARWRAEAPVCRVKLPDKQTAWLVTRYDDAVTVLKDPRFGNDREKMHDAGAGRPDALDAEHGQAARRASCSTWTRPTIPGCGPWFTRHSRPGWSRTCSSASRR